MRFNLIFIFLLSAISQQDLFCQSDEIHWLTWEDALSKNVKSPKKIFIDVYTDWCGYCKKMDASTFKDSSIVSIINENFYPVKFNAEQKEDISYNNFDYKFQKTGRRGYHQLAQMLLDGRMSYPSYVILDEVHNKIVKSSGYQTPENFMVVLKYAKDEEYTSQSFNRYKMKRQIR